MFPYYVEDNKLHLTLQVTQPQDIDSVHLGQLIYQYSQMSTTIYPEDRVDAKVNIQSEGIFEIISPLVKHGLTIFAILSVVLASPYGGKLKFFGQSLDIPGIISGHRKSKEKKLKTDEKQLEIIRKAMCLARELKVPISQLGVKLPKDLIKTLDEQLEEEFSNENRTSQLEDESDNE